MIEILPAQPEVVYVPVYDPVAIWGAPVYHPWPPFWYPPRPVDAVIAAGFVGFFLGVVVAHSFHHWGGWSRWGWGVGWHQHTVVVNNTFYVRNNYRLPSNYIRSGPSAWAHDPQHRGGVAYPSRGVAGRVGAPAGRVPMPAPRPGSEGMVITQPSRVEPRPGPPPTRSGPGSGPSVPRPPLIPQARPDRDRTLFSGSSGSGDARARSRATAATVAWEVVPPRTLRALRRFGPLRLRRAPGSASAGPPLARSTGPSRARRAPDPPPMMESAWVMTLLVRAGSGSCARRDPLEPRARPRRARRSSRRRKTRRPRWSRLASATIPPRSPLSWARMQAT